MKAIVTVLQAVLIFAIAASLVIITLPMVISSFNQSVDSSEADSVRQQLEYCNDKILETVRTGTQSTCTFSLQSGRGKISLKDYGILYQLNTEAKICDEANWVEINSDKHIWFSCEESGNKRLYQLKWSSPNEMVFSLGNKSTGSVIEINRISITADKVNLFVNFK